MVIIEALLLGCLVLVLTELVYLGWSWVIGAKVPKVPILGTPSVSRMATERRSKRPKIRAEDDIC